MTSVANLPHFFGPHDQDLSSSRDNDLDFVEITEAYEYLLNNGHASVAEGAELVSVEEENEYRAACHEVLGINAEIVEESKLNPMFRHWLEGNTDGAQHWRSFLAAHGGLAQKLRPLAGYLDGPDGAIAPKTRRKRKK